MDLLTHRRQSTSLRRESSASPRAASTPAPVTSSSPSTSAIPPPTPSPPSAPTSKRPHDVSPPPKCKGLRGGLGGNVPQPRNHLPPDCIDSVRKAVEANYGAEQGVDIYSGAGHDTCSTSKRCPSSMVFITSKDGISHNQGSIRRRKIGELRYDGLNDGRRLD